ncbi:hypothetical protein QJS04_geneDACA001107 [Acorus gramineus]|uniref:Uncharacterized protein n=2 Tax=Acorus TaxID=4464 RepID=A0AAV9D913_ACOCL|nr:hypothetical protein QJS04_geneDACA001107 [Acorus gramineus]KAK1296943.1 hypothetical protein QJS10_CPB15g00524 [Acorus calamus]KAK1320180.1 hypothetical protein QJS10_CPA03g02178 [Acorus calamus]
MSKNKARKELTFNAKRRLCDKLMRGLAKDMERMRREFGLETCVVYYPPGATVPKALPSREAAERVAMRVGPTPE